MKILAVSDVASQSLENTIEKTPEKYNDVDCIVSCGDLEADYLDLIVEHLGLNLFFVSGNHLFRDESVNHDEPEGYGSFSSELPRHLRPIIAGREDMHGRVEAFGDYYFAGFAGSMWYNGKENQFTEKEMERVVNSVQRKLLFFRFRDFLLRKRRKQIIVISHAPVACIHDLPDLCHKGFACFGKFIKKFAPILWLHGHVHPEGGNGKAQISREEDTTVINAFGCKIIEIENGVVEIKSHC